MEKVITLSKPNTLPTVWNIVKVHKQCILTVKSNNVVKLIQIVSGTEYLELHSRTYGTYQSDFLNWLVDC